MTVTVAGTPQSFAFTAAGTVVTYTGGGSTSNSIDVLCINSDNTVSVPGFTAVATAVTNQGAYIFTCDAGTTSSATINLGGGISTSTQVCWLRITGTTGVDTGATATAQNNNTTGSATPSVTSGALAGAQELALAFAALHNFAGSTPTSPVWSSGYVEQVSATIGSSTTGVYGDVAVKTPAGTAAESPSMSWTNACLNRYILVVAFQAAAVTTITPNSLSVPVSLGQPAVAQALTVAPDSLTVAVSLGSPRVSIPTVAPPSWNGILSAVREAQAVHAERQRRNQNPLECPQHQWPLTKRGNVWHCLYGGHIVTGR